MTDLPLTPAADSSRHAFEFSGDAGEFFGIWFVNSLLTLLTLGLYSPWAKIRTQQYFYGNTRLAGGAFQFLANPWSMFKTRMIAVALLIVFVIAQNLAGASVAATIVYAAFFVVWLAVSPIFLVLLMSFRTRYSAWRGTSFAFNKDYAGSYRVYLAPMLVFTLLMASVALPFYLAHESAPDSEAQLQTSPDADPAAATTESGMQRESSDEAVEIAGIAEQASDNAGQAAEEDAALDSENQQSREAADVTAEAEEGEEYSEDEDAAAEDGELLAEDDGGESSGAFAGLEWLHFLPALALTVLYVALLPYFDFIHNRFLARNVQYGTSKVKFLATARDYYGIYGTWGAGTAVVALIVAGAYYAGKSSDHAAGSYVGIAFVVLAYIVASKAFFKSRRYNTFFGNLEIGNGHRLLASTTFSGFLWLMVSNSVAYALTFGLMKAWVMVRTARYALGCTMLQAKGSLDEFVAGEKQSATPLAEETADVFDLDVG